MKTDGLAPPKTMSGPSRICKTSPKSKVSVDTQEELDEVLNDERVSSGEIPISLPKGEQFEIMSGSPCLYVTDAEPWIKVRNDATPTIIAFRLSAPLIISHGTSKPHMIAYDAAKPVMNAYDLSKPIMMAYDASEPVMTSLHSSKPIMAASRSSFPAVNWNSLQSNSGLIEL